LELTVAIILLALIVAWVVLGPLRRGSDIDRREDDRRAALEAAKEAKYREIRDAELDFRMGKLSEEDYTAIDSGLRAEAIAILRQIDALGPRDDQANERQQ
jgi:hypothetical protein